MTNTLQLQDAGNNIWTYEKLSDTECKLVSKGQRLGDPDYVLFQPIQNVRDWIRIGTWKISHSHGYTFTYPDMLYNESLTVLTNEKFLLDKIKEFTLDYTCSVTVHDGTYTVYDEEDDRTYMLNGDDELVKFMEASKVVIDALYE